MEELLFVMIGTLLFSIFVLLAKVYFLRKSAQEIRQAFLNRLTADTNTLLSMQERDESLESYYISLLGGGRNA